MVYVGLSSFSQFKSQRFAEEKGVRQYDIPSRPFLRGQPVFVPSIKLWLGNALPGVHSGNQTWLAGKSWKIPEANAGRNGKIIEPTMT